MGGSHNTQYDSLKTQSRENLKPEVGCAQRERKWQKVNENSNWGDANEVNEGEQRAAP
jgi:hypothetical protein